MNQVILIGNLTRDPELSTTPGGVSVCRFAMAVNRTYRNQDGSQETDFFNVVAWRSQADFCGKYLKKGRKVAVIGNIQNRSYDDKDGNKRYVTEIIANNVEFVETTDLMEVIGDMDILYMTRVQHERFFNEEEYLRLRDSYILTPEKLKIAKPDLCIMHPLPRVNEISTAIDKDPRACYFKQVENGKFMRAALIMMLLGLEAK